MAALKSRLLIVEDNPDDALLITRALGRVGLQDGFEVACNGDEAVEILARRGPLGFSLVLLDLKLPRKSGFEVLSWVRRESAFPHLPVVICSSSLEPEDVNRAYALGANSYVVKPLRMHEYDGLAACIRDFWCGFNRAPGRSGPGVR